MITRYGMSTSPMNTLTVFISLAILPFGFRAAQAQNAQDAAQRACASLLPASALAKAET
jgi:hypothetical protein